MRDTGERPTCRALAVGSCALMRDNGVHEAKPAFRLPAFDGTALMPR